MIVTLTANPSVDRTIEVPALERGSVLRAVASRVDAGGKGVNVARALAMHGREALAVLPCGGAEGAQLGALLERTAAATSSLRLRSVPIASAIRSNVTVVEADGTTTKLNEAGPAVSGAELEAMAEALVDSASGAEWAVLCGSLPPGAPAGWYGGLIRRLATAGTRVALDTSGAALAASVAAGPDLVKPNREELAELTGARLDTVGDVVAAAESLLEVGVGAVLASLGAAGAVLVGDGGRWHATGTLDIEARSTVGAGDAALAGFLSAGGQGPAALAEAVAWGRAATCLPGSSMPAPTDIDRAGVRVVELTQLELPTHLTLSEQP